MGLLGATGASALSAVLFALAFPPASATPLAWAGLVPFLLALRSVGAGAAIALAWLWTIVFSLGVASALPRAVETYFLQPRLASFAFAMFVWTVTAAIYFMGFAVAYRALVRRTGPIPRALLTAAAWAASELARGRLPNGSELFAANPWGMAAYSQLESKALIQIAALTGVYGISFCLVAANAGLAEIAMAFARERRVSRSVWLGALLGLLPTAAALLYGNVALRDAASADPDGGVSVAVIQPNFAVGSQWRSDAYGAHLAEQLALTARAAASGAPRIAVWPESALTFFLEQEPAYQRAIGAALSRADLELLVGGPRVVEPDDSEGQALRALRDAPEPVYYNSVFALDPRGAIVGRYDKQQLVPFAEFLPLRRFDFLRRRFERVRVFRHGDATPPLPTRAGTVGVLVCNEAMYPEVARQRVLEGATYLVNPSNDTWVQSSVWADRMFDIVALRAVEQRRYFVRASTAGPSAIVDPWGRVQGRTPNFEEAYLLGRVVPNAELSLYGRMGDAFGWTCAGAVAIALALGAIRSARPSPPRAA